MSGKQAGYWGRAGAGLLLLCEGRVFLTLRSSEVNEPGTWGIPGGTLHPGDTALTGAVRESEEELGALPEFQRISDVIYNDRGFTYTTIVCSVDPEDVDGWEVELNWENDDARWFPVVELPEPLHFGMEYLVQKRPDLFSAPDAGVRANTDADLRAIERSWDAERDPRDLARLDVERARAGRPFSPPARWRPTIEIPRSWLQWLGPSRRDGEDVDNLAYHRTLWPTTRPDGGMRYAYAILTRGGDDTYVRLEVGINDEDDDPEWLLTAYAGDVYDGAVVGLEAAYGSVVHECECDNSHQAMNRTCMWCWRHGRRQWDAPEVQEHAAKNCDLCSLRVMLRLVDHGEDPRD